MGFTRNLLLLNGLAVIAAVINHTVGWGFTSMFWWTDRYQPVAVPDFSQIGSLSYYAIRVLEQAVVWGVPAFLFVSGYFVAFASGRQSSALSWTTVGARLRMLLIPYLLWSLAIFVGRGLEGATDTSLGYAQQLLFGGAAEPYYYIPLLTQLYLLSPAMVAMMRRRGLAFLISAAVVQFAIQVARYPVWLGWDMSSALWLVRHTPGWFFPGMIFWFVFGIFAGLHLATFKRCLAGWKPFLSWVTVLLGVAALWEWEVILEMSGRQWLRPAPTALDSLFCCAAVLTFVAHPRSSATSRTWLDTLGERSFGVYLIHAPVLELLSRAAYHLLPALLAYQFVFQPLLIVVGIAVPILIMAIVNRSPARHYYNYLFG